MRRLMTMIALIPLISLSQFDVTSFGYNVLTCPTGDYIEQENCMVIQSDPTAVSHIHLSEDMKAVTITTPISALSGTWRLTNVYCVQGNVGILIGADANNVERSMMFQISGSGSNVWMTTYYPKNNSHIMYQFLGN